MSILTNQKGQGTMLGLFEVVFGLIGLVALLPVINELTTTVVAGNMSAFSNVPTIQLLLGMIGIICIIAFLFKSWQALMGGGQSQGQIGGM
jgi:uncharacterized membrane protein